MGVSWEWRSNGTRDREESSEIYVLKTTCYLCKIFMIPFGKYLYMVQATFFTIK